MSALPASIVRRSLFGALGAMGISLSSPALAVRPRANSPQVAIDSLLVRSGVTRRWAAAMSRDLGWAAQWLNTPSREVLSRLESGESSVGIFLSHPRADHLVREGLIHDRQRLASTEVWLIGPAADPAGIRGEHDPARAIAQIKAAEAAGVASWQAGESRSPDDPLAQLAARLQGHGAIQPSLTDHRLPGYRLITHAEWLFAEQRSKGSSVWLRGHPALVLHAEVARSFRGKHPGGSLLVEWLDSAMARGAWTGTAGWLSKKD
jgi:hypothetical protein